MRIVSWNVNGLRAAIRKGIDRFIDELNPHVLLLQEVRALPTQLPAEWANPVGWEADWNPAEKKGYSGTSTWTRSPSIRIVTGMGNGVDPEGRILVTQMDDFLFVNVYLPSGSASDERQERKEAWMAECSSWVSTLVDLDQPVLVAGDLNIAHTELDIWNPKGNAKMSGFLPHERMWFTQLLSQGWKDHFRQEVGQVQGPYSWWSNRGRARELDRGWRIDYILTNPACAERIIASGILRRGGLEISDHAPIWIDLSE